MHHHTEAEAFTYYELEFKPHSGRGQTTAPVFLVVVDERLLVSAASLLLSTNIHSLR